MVLTRRRRPAPNLVQGQKAWLLRRHVATTRPSSKLDVRRLGIFPILEQIGSSAFRLELPPSMHIHPVFHVSLLEPHVANTFPGRVVDPLLPLQVDGFPEFEVDFLLDSKFRRLKLFYKIRWVAYDTSEDSWEPAINLSNASLAISMYHQKYHAKPCLLIVSYIFFPYRLFLFPFDFFVLSSVSRILFLAGGYC